MLKDVFSSSTSLQNNRICRICHIVERGPKSGSQLNVKGKADPVDSFNKFLKGAAKIFTTGLDFKKLHLSEDEMIAPCQCKGTMRFVHRGCLNQWRAVSGRNDSFQRCEQCFALYKFNEGTFSTILTSRLFILCVTAVIFWLWILASMLVTTSTEAAMFNLLPKVSSDFKSWPLKVLQDFLKIQVNTVLIDFLLTAIRSFNSLMDQASRLFYGLIFIAITEFIFLTPSFLLSFNLLFCVWRIQKYELFFDKWLLAGMTVFGVLRAWRSIESVIENMCSRAIKLRVLEVQNQFEADEKKEN
jgi:E3 ubiquitin-protein ligase DOA10